MKVILVTNKERTHIFNHIQMKWETIEEVNHGVIAHFYYYTWYTPNGVLADIDFAKTSRYGVDKGDVGYDFEYIIVEKEISPADLIK